MASSGSDGEVRVGVAVRPLAALLAQLRAVLEGLDPAQLPARDAVEVVAVCDQLSRVADAGKALAAGRVAESSLWKRSGHRSAAHWMAAVTGVGVGDAVKLLQTAETATNAREAELFTGSLSEANLRLYGRCGYRETERVPQGDGTDQVFLRKSLTPRATSDGG